MPTPSKPNPTSTATYRPGEWSPRLATSPRSIFPNYRPKVASPAISAPSQEAPEAATENELGTGSHPSESSLGAVEQALARSFIYSFLVQAFADPTPETWNWLCQHTTHQALLSALRALEQAQPAQPVSHCSAMQDTAKQLRSLMAPDAFDLFSSSYVAAFGHAARGRCPLNEIEYGDIKADPLFQPHRLADLAGFYHAFGLDLAEEADERQDHLCLELEFMTVLCAREAYATQHQLGLEPLSICRDAQRKFLRQHLGRWSPAFARRLSILAGGGLLGALAELLRNFIETECARHKLVPGSEDLLLRPISQTDESLCASCGLAQLPPGALASSDL